MGEKNDAITFLATLFQVPKHKLFRSKVQDLDEFFQPVENEEDQPHMNQSAQEQKTALTGTTGELGERSQKFTAASLMIGYIFTVELRQGSTPTIKLFAIFFSPEIASITC